MASICFYNLFVFKHFVWFLQILHKQVLALGLGVLPLALYYQSASNSS